MPEDSNPNATFYQYRLIKKINFSNKLLLLYMILPCLAVLVEMYFISWTSLIYWILAAPIVLWVQYVISRTTVILTGYHYRKRWKFQLRLPWLGYFPIQHMNYRTYRKVQFYTFWVGIIVFSALIFWSPAAFIISLWFWHLWLMLPAMIIYFKLLRVPNGGMLKLNHQDASYYLQ